jgi:hypothetical protein
MTSGISSLIPKKAPTLQHIIEEGKHIIKNLTLKYGSDAVAVYLRETNYVEGYSFVGNSYYKFRFLTYKEYSEKSEVLRMLWGANQQFVGCPKPSEPITNRAFNFLLF